MSTVRRGRQRGEKPRKANRPLTSRQRHELPDRAYALPSLRKYPLYTIDKKTGRLKASRRHAGSAKGYAKQMLDEGKLTRAQYAQVVRKANKILEQTAKAKPRRAAKTKNPTFRKGARVSMPPDVCVRIDGKTGATKRGFGKQRHYGTVLGVYARIRDNRTGRTFSTYRVRLDSGTILAVHPKCMRRTTANPPPAFRAPRGTSLVKSRRLGQRMSQGMTTGQDHRTHPLRGPVAIDEPEQYDPRPNPPRKRKAPKRRRKAANPVHTPPSGAGPKPKTQWWRFQLRGVRKAGDPRNPYGYGRSIGTKWFQGTERQSTTAAATLVGASHRRKKIAAVMRDGPFAKRGG